MTADKQAAQRLGFSDISSREKILMGLAVLTLIFFIAARFIVRPVYNDYLSKIETVSRLDKRKAELKEYEISNSVIAKKLDKAKSEAAELKLAINKTKRDLKDNKRLNGVLNLLDNLKTGSGMELVGLSIFSKRITQALNPDEKPTSQVKNARKVEPAEVKPSRSPVNSIEYNRNVIQINIKSEYPYIAFFLSRLFEASFAPSVKRIAVGAGSKSEPDMLTAEIELTVITL